VKIPMGVGVIPIQSREDIHYTKESVEIIRHYCKMAFQDLARLYQKQFETFDGLKFVMRDLNMMYSLFYDAVNGVSFSNQISLYITCREFDIPLPAPKIPGTNVDFRPNTMCVKNIYTGKINKDFFKKLADGEVVLVDENKIPSEKRKQLENRNYVVIRRKESKNNIERDDAKAYELLIEHFARLSSGFEYTPKKTSDTDISVPIHVIQGNSYSSNRNYQDDKVLLITKEERDSLSNVQDYFLKWAFDRIWQVSNKSRNILLKKYPSFFTMDTIFKSHWCIEKMLGVTMSAKYNWIKDYLKYIPEEDKDKIKCIHFSSSHVNVNDFLKKADQEIVTKHPIYKELKELEKYAEKYNFLKFFNADDDSEEYKNFVNEIVKFKLNVK
jgi:hypothetical protein